MEAKKLAQIKYIPINLLKEWDLNPRKNDSAVDKLSKLIESHGFINPVIATKDNIIRAGHTRVKAAKKAGLKEVPVILIDMDEKQAQAFAIADNKSSEWAEWDFTKLKDLIEELDDGQFDLELTGFDTKEIENLMTFVPEGEPEVLESKEDDFNAEPPKTPITVLGDLYELNKHRLHCADSTDITAVEKLMNGKKADMVFTDPPYGLDNQRGKETMFIHGSQTNVKRDKLLNDASVSIYERFIPLIKIFTSNVFYMFYGAGTEVDFYSAIKNNQIELINTLVWNKPKGSGALGANYKPCYESFIYGKLHKGERLWSGKHDQWTVFDSSKDKCKDHPTQKPIKLIADVLLNHNTVTIADPFLGSGSTLIASEQLNRICYGQELSPNYCDVIIKRYVTYMRKENKPYTIKRNDVILSEDEINKYFDN